MMTGGTYFLGNILFGKQQSSMLSLVGGFLVNLNRLYWRPFQVGILHTSTTSQHRNRDKLQFNIPIKSRQLAHRQLWWRWTPSLIRATKQPAWEINVAEYSRHTFLDVILKEIQCYMVGPLKYKHDSLLAAEWIGQHDNAPTGIELALRTRAEYPNHLATRFTILLLS